MQPEYYHIRRLLKLAGTQTKTTARENWECITERIVKLKCDLVPADASGAEIDHWIPNTVEPNKPFRIKIWGIDTNGRTVPADEKDILLLAPRDQFFNAAEDTDNRNIYNNKGDGFVLYGTDKNDPGKTDTLADFKTNDKTELKKLTADTHYTIHYYNKYFVSPLDGRANDYFTFKVENGYLCFVYKKDTERFEGDTFAVKTLSTNIRPGDDILLRFALVEDPKVTGIVFDDDFMAVYDKKLLWRANLYIDEGVNDWNNLNTLNGQGQINLSAWTRFSDGEVVNGAVAYSTGCADWVDDFAADLQDQQNAITAYYTGTNNTVITPNPNPALHRNWSPWNNTFAPPDTSNSDWVNYLSGTLQANGTYNSLTINGTNHNPYTPGFSTWRWMTNQPGRYRAFDTGYSAGVDCSGFIQRCMDYQDTPYLAPSVDGRLLWGGTTPGLIGPAGFSDNTITWEISNKNVLIPGDILAANDHVVMIYKITYAHRTREVADRSDRVFVIEAARGPNNEWSVINTQRWTNLGVGYEHRRLRVN